MCGKKPNLTVSRDKLWDIRMYKVFKNISDFEWRKIEEMKIDQFEKPYQQWFTLDVCKAQIDATWKGFDENEFVNNFL